MPSCIVCFFTYNILQDLHWRCSSIATSTLITSRQRQVLVCWFTNEVITHSWLRTALMLKWEWEQQWNSNRFDGHPQCVTTLHLSVITSVLLSILNCLFAFSIIVYLSMFYIIFRTVFYVSERVSASWWAIQQVHRRKRQSTHLWQSIRHNGKTPYDSRYDRNQR